MLEKKGFTLLETLIALIIIGIIVAVALPYYFNSVFQSKVQAVENNLRAISVKEQKYNEDNSQYCTTSNVCQNFGSINQNLSLSMSNDTVVNDGFVYSCIPSGSTSTISCPPLVNCTFTCSAVSASLNQTVSIDANGVLTCTGALTICP